MGSYWDEDNVDFSVYYKFIGIQPVFDDAANDGGYHLTQPIKGIVQHHVTIPDGSPVSISHQNLLIEAHSYVIDIEDGTTGQYFTNTIAAENIQSS